MAWALHGGGRAGTSTAVRMHVSFDLLKDAPVSVQITPGKTCERKTLRLEVDTKPGGAYSYFFGVIDSFADFGYSYRP